MPAIESLLVVSACMRSGGVLTDEAAVRKAVDRAPRRYKPLVHSLGDLVLRAQRSILFAVDKHEVLAACDSFGDPPADIPPLPFPEVIFEAAGDTTFNLHAQDPATGAIVKTWVVDAVAVTEIKEGAEWGIVYYARDGVADDPDNPTWRAAPMRLTRDTLVVMHRSVDGTWNEETSYSRHAIEAAAHWRFIVELVHFVTARGVSLSELVKTRPVNRRAARAGAVLPPRLYWVRIADGTVNAKSGGGERAYTCRWLVRGHWRRLGAHERTWVRPYVKGPASAPWRGRPVYHVEAAA